MIKSFEELYTQLKKVEPVNLVVAAAEDEDVILSVKEAYDKKLINPILVGNQREIEDICESFSIDPKIFQIVNALDDADTVNKALTLIKDSKGDILMKGHIHTSTILKGVLNKEYGLRQNTILSHVILTQVECFTRMLFITDASMNISPGVDDKEKIINNCVNLAHHLGYSNPHVGVICGVETVNPKMPATVDAQELVNRYKSGRIVGCTVSGPLALDNALSLRAVKIKEIDDPYAGKSEILLMPDIEAGNIFFKSIAYLSPSKLAGVIMGARVPVVLTSRADSATTKLHSIALSVYITRKS